MKKLVLAIAIVLGMGIGAYAQGGLFKYGQEAEQTRGGGDSYSWPRRDH